MTRDHKQPKSGNRVNWGDPELESLLRKTEHWKLDNRGGYAAQEVQVHVGWGVGVDRPAALVWERDQMMVLEVSFSIPPGEHVRVDRFVGDGLRSVWGVVVEVRAGHRDEDLANGVHVCWVRVR